MSEVNTDAYVAQFVRPLSVSERRALERLPANGSTVDTAEWFACLAVDGGLSDVGALMICGAVEIAHGYGYRECSLSKEGRRLLDEAKVAT